MKLTNYIKAAMLLVLTMILGVNTAFAQTTPSNALTLKNTGATNHTFEIYQVFKGDVSTDSKTLSNIQWGDGVTNIQWGRGVTNTTDFTDVAEAVDLATTDPQAFADSLTLGKATATKVVEADASHTFNLEAGYYLVKDEANSQNDVENGASTLYILEVVGTVEAETKLSVPTVEKKVKDITNGTLSDWQDTADHAIGDAVPFQLTASLPSNYADYSSYKLVFHDNLSDGFDTPANVKYYVQNGDDMTVISGSSVTTDKSKLTFMVDLPQVGVTKESKIVVEYTATLNENAVIGSGGNPNEVYLEYSNNPNNGWEGETGKTPTDKVIVFTYQTIVDKVRPDGTNEDGTPKYAPLAGAEFTLEKKVGEEFVKVDRLTISEDKTSFSFNGLDDGTYRLTETKTPDGYNTIQPIEFTISATHDDALLSLTELSATSTSATFTADKTKGSLKTNVVNKAGITLPSTGGMGTTLLYTVSGVLFLVAIGYYAYDRKHSLDKK